MKNSSQQTEWLSLIEVSGPFLALPVLEQAFPQGLDSVTTPMRQRLHSAYEEWAEAVESDDPLLPKLHQEWIRMVLTEFLEYDELSLETESEITAAYKVSSPDQTDSFDADWIVVSPTDHIPRLFISIQAPGVDLEKPRKVDRWPASLHERIVALCRAHHCRLGLITNGERWMLVNAPVGGISSDASWYARLWFQETITLKAFQSLLSVRRCFGPKDEMLESLFDKSLEHHEEITDTLGEQVRRAVEVLIQCLDRADADRNRDLLRDVSSAELYEAGLTVMMRLVFILCAEERGLLLLGDPVYDANYAISTLRNQLAEDAVQFGPEVLDRRHDAWARLIATFRAVYGGIEHEALRLPPLGGSVFDPDRFSFLEGRTRGTGWRRDAASPIPIDNRTVLLLLNSLQVLEQPSGALLLSYRALDVEQIGHVYEGLLEHTVVRVSGVTVGLMGAKNAKNPNLPLEQMESTLIIGQEALINLLTDTTKRSVPAIRNGMEKSPDETTMSRLLISCSGDARLAERITMFANLLRTDAWGDLIIYPENSFMVTIGMDRRESGTHYTPKSLTEKVVAATLEPLVFIGPAEGTPCAEWQLKSSKELLDLKVCDPAMGSGAFLVQACRWLAERLVEAWEQEKDRGKFINSNGDMLDIAGDADPLPESLDECLLVAKRLIAERCLYGVDINPLAVELAKLSIWLVTMAKGRPFGFLDHNLRSGDSLLGIHRLAQLNSVNLSPSKKSNHTHMFGMNIAKAVAETIGLREKIRIIPLRDIRDVEEMERMDEEARRKIAAIELIADAMMGEAIRFGGNTKKLEESYVSLSMLADDFLRGHNEQGNEIAKIAKTGLLMDLSTGRPHRKPFHWALEFPEVFTNDGGFDAIVGNPPFMGGQRITGALGTAYRDWLVQGIAEGAKGSADIVAYFFLRAFSLLRENGGFGLLAVNTIAEGDTRQVGLERLLKKGATIYIGYPNEPWPGKAAVAISRIHVRRGSWFGRLNLSGNEVKVISAFLSDQDEWSPKTLEESQRKSYQGSIVLGMGFVLSAEEAKVMVSANSKNAEVLFPYLNGEDLNNDPEQKAARWVINFWDWPEEKAMEYELPYRRILEFVKPERQRRKITGEYSLRKPLPQNWWIYGEKRPGLYHAVGRGYCFIKHPEDWDASGSVLERILVCSRYSKYWCPIITSNDQVFSDSCVVFALRSYSYFSIMQSAIHSEWAWKQASSLESRLRYTPSDVFETFPFPIYMPPILDDLGAAYHKLRSSIMISEHLGLTKLYNRFHDQKRSDSDICKLRELHRQIDEAVAATYGWSDIRLGHGFHEVPYLPENDCIRYTISESARIEVLRRLAELNKMRYEEELKDNTKGKKPGNIPIKANKRKGKRAKGETELGLFDIPD